MDFLFTELFFPSNEKEDFMRHALLILLISIDHYIFQSYIWCKNAALFEKQPDIPKKQLNYYNIDE